MVSSKDVAKHAGVSQTTVSRVLNTPNLVKKPTVDKVMAAIEELHYIPNAHARSLVQNKTNTIALLSGPLHNPFLSIQQQQLLITLIAKVIVCMFNL